MRFVTTPSSLAFFFYFVERTLLRRMRATLHCTTQNDAKSRSIRTSPAAVSAASAAAPSTHSGTTSLARSPSLPAPPPSPPVAATSASPSSPAPARYSHTATPASSHALLLIPLTPYVISIIVFHSHRPCLNADINLSGFAFYLDG